MQALEVWGVDVHRHGVFRVSEQPQCTLVEVVCDLCGMVGLELERDGGRAGRSDADGAACWEDAEIPSGRHVVHVEYMRGTRGRHPWAVSVAGVRIDAMSDVADTRRPSVRVDPDRWIQSRSGLLVQGRLFTALALCVLWLALYLVVGAVCSTVANALPGISRLESLSVPMVFLVTGGCLVLFVVLFVRIRLQYVASSRRWRRVVARTRALTVRLLRDVLGLTHLGWRRTAVIIGAGIVGAFVARGTTRLLWLVPALADTVPAADLREDAMMAAPEWVPPVFFAVYAPAPEEMAFRGLLLAVCAIVAVTTRNRWIRVGVITVALLATSAMFGAIHLDWSLMNAVAAGLGGLIFGILAVSLRSLWAPIIAHALYNALIFLI